jgi:hypothetical protein
VWQWGLRDAIEAPSRFSPIPYFLPGASAEAKNKAKDDAMRTEVELILQTSIAVNNFWCSSRKVVDCKDGTQSGNNKPTCVQRSFDALPSASKWRRSHNNLRRYKYNAMPMVIDV